MNVEVTQSLKLFEVNDQEEEIVFKELGIEKLNKMNDVHGNENGIIETNKKESFKDSFLFCNYLQFKLFKYNEFNKKLNL